MTDAPERIWTTGNDHTGSWNNHEINPKHAPNQTEYIRSDHVDTLLKAEREKALREVGVICNQSYGGSIGDVHKAILALISEDKNDG